MERARDHSLRRPYEPGNCQFVTASRNARNRRSNRLITLNGETKCLADWVDHYGIAPYETVRHRIAQLGWTPIKALTTTTRR